MIGLPGFQFQAAADIDGGVLFAIHYIENQF
jgi:hypothetical protein